jgi:uncharacterized membrane protein YqjE
MANLSPGPAAAAGEAEAGGLIGNARRIGRTLLSIFATRLELLGVEAAEQGVRIGVLLLLGAVAFLLAAFALAMFSFGVAVVFWDSHRLAAIFGLGLVYAALAALAVAQVKARLKSHPSPFAATVAELKADAAALDRH